MEKQYFLLRNTNKSRELLLFIIFQSPVDELCNFVMPNGSATLPVFIVTARNNTPSLDKSFYTVCRSGSAGIFAWVKYSDYEHQIASEIHAFEVGLKLSDCEMN